MAKNRATAYEGTILFKSSGGFKQAIKVVAGAEANIVALLRQVEETVIDEGGAPS